jgi:hypothetical protein
MAIVDAELARETPVGVKLWCVTVKEALLENKLCGLRVKGEVLEPRCGLDHGHWLTSIEVRPAFHSPVRDAGVRRAYRPRPRMSTRPRLEKVHQ